MMRYANMPKAEIKSIEGSIKQLEKTYGILDVEIVMRRYLQVSKDERKLKREIKDAEDKLKKLKKKR